jgi:hypothetical protein
MFRLLNVDSSGEMVLPCYMVRLMQQFEKGEQSYEKE